MKKLHRTLLPMLRGIMGCAGHPATIPGGRSS